MTGSFVHQFEVLILELFKAVIYHGLDIHAAIPRLLRDEMSQELNVARRAFEG